MTKITAHFTDKNIAETARDQLQNAGIEASQMHIWNDLGASLPSSNDGVESGAILGGALFGVSGLLGGAALGDSLDNASSSSSSQNGVRLVVEVATDDERSLVEQTLRDAGASRVHVS